MLALMRANGAFDRTLTSNATRTMICPACSARKHTSEVYSAGTSFTDLPMVASGPADGLPHLHDPNSRREGFECIKGHRFRVETFVRCGQCDHGHREPLTVLLETRAQFRPKRT